MNPSDRTEDPSGGRPPHPARGPVIIILVILAVLTWMFWLMRSPPRPLPEVPPHRVLPQDVPHPQDPRTQPEAGGAQNPG